MVCPPVRWLLLLLMLSSALPADTGTYGDYSYTSDGVAITITEYKGTGTDVLIPDSIDGLPVRRVSGTTFQKTPSITSVNLPDSVTQIDQDLFWNINSLSSVRLPANLLRIPDELFCDCQKLASVSLPEHLIEIGSRAFENTRLSSISSWPASLTIIGERAFARCEYLTEVSIPSSVTSLGEGSFSSCPSLTSFTMPKTLTAWPAYLLADSYSLSHVEVPEGVTSLGAGVFRNTGLTELSLPSTLTEIPEDFAYYATELARVNIPAGVKRIGENAFRYCSLSSIELPSGLEAFGTRAFLGNCYLESITIPEGISELPPELFFDCTSLRSVTLPKSLRTIWGGAFAYCLELPSITLPSGLTTLAGSAFQNCTSIQDITIPPGITTLGTETFRDCKSLKKIALPPGLTNIGDMCFRSCVSLTDIDLPAGLMTLGTSAFAGCTALNSVRIPDGVTSLDGTFTDCISIKEFKLPSRLSSIGWATFYGCKALETLTLPASVSQLTISAIGSTPALRYMRFLGNTPTVTDVSYKKPDGFIILIPYGPSGFTTPTWLGFSCITMSGDYGVTDYSGGLQIIRYEGAGGSLSIPAQLSGKPVRSLGTSAFAGNSKISSVTLPASLTEINNQAFKGCSALMTASFLGDSPTSFGSDVFAGADPQFRVLYGIEAVGFTSPLWKGYPAEAYGYGYVDTGNGVTLKGIPSATGSVIVPSSIGGKPVTCLASSVFRGNALLTSVSLPASLNQIEDGAFDGCSSLESILMESGGSNFASIDGVLFNGDTTRLLVYPENRKMDDYVVPSGTLQIAPKAFASNPWLSSVTFPVSITGIGNSAFVSCTHLTRAAFLSNPPKDFGSGVFDDTALSFCIWFNADAKGFSEPTWKGYPATAIAFGFKELAGKLSIVSYFGSGGVVTIPASFNGKPITSIASHTFAGCSDVTSLIIPASILSISPDAFDGCVQLASISVMAGNPAFATRNGVLYNATLTELLRYPPAASGSFAVPAGVHSINTQAFSGCERLTALQLPPELDSIGNAAFAGCSSLTQVNFTGDAPTMDPMAFTGTGQAMAIYYLSGARGFESSSVAGHTPLPLYPNRISNLSTRSYVGSGDKIQIAGFVVTGSQPKRLLIRASGPALAGFGVADTLLDPELKLFDSTQKSVASSSDWDSDSIDAVATSLGAFPWAKGSKDAALLVTLPPGSYTAQVSGRAGTTGVALVEVYDADNSPISNKLTNISTRSLTKTADKQQIAGFVITGDKPKQVLIRASGPALAAFGLTEAMADPVLRVVDAKQEVIAANDDWNADSIQPLAQKVGAFDWTKGSKDAALSLTLQPGAYTATVCSKNDSEGVTLIEVYELP